MLAADLALSLIEAAIMRDIDGMDVWGLQEVLLAVDEKLCGTGGETTGFVGLFRGGDVICAAAGDTSLVFMDGDGELGWFPRPRTRFRLGSGSADVCVLEMSIQFPTMILTDGAAACVSYEEVAAAFNVHQDCDALAAWISLRISERIRQVGDDCTAIVMGGL
jgi:hypothetical protein